MNIFHTFVKLLQTQARQANLRVCLFVYLYFCLFHTIYFIDLLIFNNGRENFQKYHWIQYTKTQLVVITRKKQAKRMNLFLIGTFPLFVYKSLIIVVNFFQKYHWIQHKQTQPVVALSELFDQT